MDSARFFKGSGSWKERRCGARHDQPGLKAVDMIKVERELKGRIERSVRFFIMSKEISPERAVKLARSRRAIENSLTVS